MIHQQQIITTARSWLNTPFKFQGRLKGIGCDCLGLIMGIAKELGFITKNRMLFTKFDQTNYNLTFDGKKLEQQLDDHLNVINELKIGSLALLEFDNNPRHLAIISDNNNYKLGLIHADLTCRKVIEHGLNDKYQNKIIKTYELTFS